MLPGLASGAAAASRNFGVLRGIVGATGSTIGGLGANAGAMLGSSGWGRDLRTVGRGNVEIIQNLGQAGLFLADAFRHVAVEASPLTVWLSKMAHDGSAFIATWAGSARASGEMAKFFREARVDMTLLGSMTGHTGRGLINLFGAQDVDGTRTLRSLDALTGRFERWSNNPAVLKNVGDAIIAEIPQAVGAAMSAVAANLPSAGVHAARVFVRAFAEADVWGQLLGGAFLANKLGGTKALKNLLGIGMGRGATPGNPIFVKDVGGKIGLKDGKTTWIPPWAKTAAAAFPVGVVLNERARAQREAGIPGSKPIGSFASDVPGNLALADKITRGLGLGSIFQDREPKGAPAGGQVYSPGVVAGLSRGPFPLETTLKIVIGEREVQRAQVRGAAKERARAR
jgi:hypothetical protein